MRLISLGPDKVSDYDLQYLVESKPISTELRELIYWYETGCYEGHGLVVYFDSDDNWHIDNLGHCSCHGPFDGGWNRITYTREQIIDLLRNQYSGVDGASDILEALQ